MPFAIDRNRLRRPSRSRGPTNAGQSHDHRACSTRSARPLSPRTARHDVAERRRFAALAVAHAAAGACITPASTRARSSRVNSCGMSVSRGTVRIVCPMPASESSVEDPRRAARIELGERIVEQEQRRRAARLAQRRRFEHPQRDRRRALLTRRSERAQVASVERECQVVAVRTGLRHPAPHVERELGRKRRRDRRRRIVGSVQRAGVAQRCRAAILRSRRRAARSATTRRATQSRRCCQSTPPASRQRHVPHAHACVGPPRAPRVAERGVAARQRPAIRLERREVRARGEREQDVQIPAARHRRPAHQLDVGAARTSPRAGRRARRSIVRIETPSTRHPLPARAALEAHGDAAPARTPRPRRGTRARRTARDPRRAHRARCAATAGSRPPRAGSSSPARSRPRRPIRRRAGRDPGARSCGSRAARVSPVGWPRSSPSRELRRPLLEKRASCLPSCRRSPPAGRTSTPRAPAPRPAGCPSRGARPRCSARGRADRWRASVRASCVPWRAVRPPAPRAFTRPMRSASAASMVSPGEQELQRAARSHEPRQSLRAAVARDRCPASPPAVRTWRAPTRCVRGRPSRARTRRRGRIRSRRRSPAWAAVRCAGRAPGPAATSHARRWGSCRCNSAMSAPATNARPCAGDDGAGHVVARPHLVDGLTERAHQRVVDRVELVGAGDGDRRDAICDVEREQGFWT